MRLEPYSSPAFLELSRKTVEMSISLKSFCPHILLEVYVAEVCLRLTKAS